MNERIHAYLDGELPRALLSEEEENELLAVEEAASATAGYVRGDPVPDFAARVMAALPEPRRAPSAAERVSSGVREALRWLWVPREFTLRPAYAFGAGLALVAAVLAAPLAGPGAAPSGPVAAAPPAAQVYVQFRLDAPGASQVSLAGSFTRWRPGPELREVAPGVWTATVPLPPGVHDYLYVVDGEEWVPDPAARPVEDGFGGTNSRLFLASPVSRT
jgi:hypothetical protein